MCFDDKNEETCLYRNMRLGINRQLCRVLFQLLKCKFSIEMCVCVRVMDSAVLFCEI